MSTFNLNPLPTSYTHTDDVSAGLFDRNDYYTFSVATDSNFNFTLTPTTGDADLYLYQVVNGDFISGSLISVGASTYGGLSIDSINTILASGDYMLSVSPFYGNVEYTLDINSAAIIVAPIYWDYSDYGMSNTFGLGELTVGTDITTANLPENTLSFTNAGFNGSFDDSHDGYSFTLTSPSTVTINLTSDINSDVDLGLYDVENNWIDGSNQAIGTDTVVADLPAGTYWVNTQLAYTVNTDDIATYDLSLSAVDNTPPATVFTNGLSATSLANEFNVDDANIQITDARFTGGRTQAAKISNFAGEINSGILLSTGSTNILKQTYNQYQGTSIEDTTDNWSNFLGKDAAGLPAFVKQMQEGVSTTGDVFIAVSDLVSAQNVLSGLQPGELGYLDPIASVSDTVSLSFDFTSTANTIDFDLKFGSEEFPLFADHYVDGAIIKVDGINFAYFDPTRADTLLSVTQANVDAGYFHANTQFSDGTSVYATEFNGLSDTINVLAPLDTNLTTHNITITIADTNDHVLDSAIFLTNLHTLNQFSDSEVASMRADATTRAGLMRSIAGTSSNSDVLVGGDTNDYAEAGDGDDNVDAGNGNDIISGDLGNDTVSGGEGDDYTYGGEGDDSMDGGNGNDTVSGGVGRDDLFGGEGDDEITSGNDTDTTGDDVDGGEGNDTITGAGGDDTMLGGTGDDSVSGGLGRDDLFGGEGDDEITSGDSTDTIGDDVDGGEGNDTITGAGGDDTMIGGVGDDSVSGGLGRDDLFGGAGDDEITGGDSTDTTGDDLDGGEGDDTITGAGGADTITGGTGEDAINGGAGNDTITGGTDDLGDDLAGGTGNDSVTGGTGDDTVSGGNGRDSLIAGAGDDVVTGGDSTDKTGDNLNSGTGDDTVTGASGSDTINGGSGADSVNAGAGNDTITSGTGADTVNGGSGNDTITGGTDKAGDSLAGGAGNDSVTGSAGNDTITAGTGADTVNGGTGGDTIIGGTDATGDSLAGGAGNDSISGGGSSDTITAGTGADSVDGGAGNDTITGGTDSTGDSLAGGAGNDSVTGGGSSDTITAGTGADTLDGGAGSDAITGGTDTVGDSLAGGAGNDTITGGNSSDTVSGGTGHDNYVLTSTASVMTITDFSVADDTISFVSSAFTSLTSPISADNFVIGEFALDDNDFLIYNSNLGSLLYDADGSGAEAAVEVALISPTNLGLTNLNFFVV